MYNNMPKLLKNIKIKAEKGQYKRGLKEKYFKRLDELSTLYSNVEISDSNSQTFEELLKIGSNLLEDNNYLSSKNMDSFLSLAYRDYYEFNGTLKTINLKIGGSYVLICALFLLLSSQLFSRVVPILFLAPMFIGIRGISKRSYTGFMIGTTVVEMAILSSSIALITVFSALRKYDAFINSLSIQYNKSPQFARNVLIFIVLVSIIMLCVSIYNIIISNKYKKMYS